MNPRFKTFLIILFCLMGVAVSLCFAIYLIDVRTHPPSEQAVYIIDGDTFNIESGETIRLLCVDTPETGETGYEDAKAYLSALILGKDVLIERGGIDKYNRTLAWVSLDIDKNEILVNKEIVENGFGAVFEYPENSTKCAKKFSG